MFVGNTTGPVLVLCVIWNLLSNKSWKGSLCLHSKRQKHLAAWALKPKHLTQGLHGKFSNDATRSFLNSIVLEGRITIKASDTSQLIFVVPVFLHVLINCTASPVRLFYIRQHFCSLLALFYHLIAANILGTSKFAVNILRFCRRGQ